MTHVGVSLVDPAIDGAALAALATEADRRGYRTIWTNESTAREAFATLGTWAAGVQRARLGTGVCPIYARPPLTAAMGAATIADRLGGPGRMVLGVGSGHRLVAERMFGAPPPTVDAVGEYVAVVRRLLAGERVEHAGPWVRLGGARVGLPSPGTPVVVAAMGPRMTEMARRSADGVLLNWSRPTYLARVAEALHDGDGTFEVDAYVRVAVADDAAAARAALRRELAGYLRLPAYRAHLARQGWPEVAEAVASVADGGVEAIAAVLPEPVVDELGVAGTAEDVAAAFGRYRAVGLDEAIVRPVPVEVDGRRVGIGAAMRAILRPEGDA